MKKQLTKLPEPKLRAIASDYSIVGTRKEIEAQLAAYMKDYGIVWADLACRYNLETKC
jgi:hypothetical protein